MRSTLHALGLALLVGCLTAMSATAALAAEGGLRDRLAQRLGAGATATAADAVPWGPGEHRLSLPVAGQAREVIVRVPASLDRARPVPLVLVLHGGGGHAAWMADDSHYGLQAQAERSGWIVAFPNGFSRLPGGRFATWNAGGCCGAARDEGSDDVAYLRAVVAALRERLPVDGQRIFAAGMSNGGMMAHRLACDAADLFRAVASVAGTDATRQCTPSRPIPVLQIHALDDDHVLYQGGAGPGAFRDRRQVMDFVSVPETLHRWVQRNHCAAEPQPQPSPPGVACQDWRGCASGVTVRLCSTDHGGHHWPGAPEGRRSQALAGTALDANAEIWRFFEAAAR